MNKIGIIGAGTGTLPTEVLRMAKEANVEIVELDKDYSPLYSLRNRTPNHRSSSHTCLCCGKYLTSQNRLLNRKKRLFE